MADNPTSNERKRLRRELQVACAIVHGAAAGRSLNELIDTVLEDGLPARDVRERIRDQKLEGEPDEEVCGPHKT